MLGLISVEAVLYNVNFVHFTQNIATSDAESVIQKLVDEFFS